MLSNSPFESPDEQLDALIHTANRRARRPSKATRR
jgi:hypothetical protein